MCSQNCDTICTQIYFGKLSELLTKKLILVYNLQAWALQGEGRDNKTTRHLIERHFVERERERERERAARPTYNRLA